MTAHLPDTATLSLRYGLDDNHAELAALSHCGWRITWRLWTQVHSVAPHLSGNKDYEC